MWITEGKTKKKKAQSLNSDFAKDWQLKGKLTILLGMEQMVTLEQLWLFKNLLAQEEKKSIEARCPRQAFVKLYEK